MIPNCRAIIVAITVVGAAAILVLRHLRDAQPPTGVNDAITHEPVPSG
jgi:hypothetical protein